MLGYAVKGYEPGFNKDLLSVIEPVAYGDRFLKFFRQKVLTISIS